MKFKAIAFDIEGTLVDSVCATIDSWHVVLCEISSGFDRSMLQAFSGMDGDLMLRKLMPDASAALRKTLMQRQKEYFRLHHLAGVRVLPGAIDTLKLLKSTGFKLAVVTNCDKSETAHYVNLLGAYSVFDYVATGDDVECGKPDPALLCQVVSRFGLHPSQIILVGDTPYDGQAALSAATSHIGVLTGGFKSVDLHNESTLFVIGSVRDIPAGLRTSNR